MRPDARRGVYWTKVSTTPSYRSRIALSRAVCGLQRADSETGSNTDPPLTRTGSYNLSHVRPRTLRIGHGVWRVRPLLVLMSALMTPAAGWAQPDFSQSTITTEPATAVAGEVIQVMVRARNTGNQGAPFAEVKADLPLEAMLADVAGPERTAIDPVAHVLEAVVDLPPQGERLFQIPMVVPRDAAGKMLSLNLRVRYLHLGVEFFGGSPVPIEGRASTGGVAVGSVRVHPAAFGVLAVLALYPILRVLTRSRARGSGPVVAIVIAVGFWALFLPLALDDWRTLRAFRETSCTVLDTRMRTRTETSRVTRSRSVPATTTTSYEPLLALRYVADGRQTISTGYRTGSRLSIGGAARAEQEYAAWTIGKQIPCWFDPEDIGRVVVLRRFGGAYLFALFPLPLFAYGVATLLSRKR